MTMVDTIDGIRKWLEEKVCPQLTFKQAPPIDRPDGKYYKPKKVHPKAWAIYYPSGEVAKFLDYDCPCAVVQPKNFDFSQKKGITKLELRIAFMTWSPGEHFEDVYDPEEDPETPVFNTHIGRYVQRTKLNAVDTDENGFVPDDDGWRDALIFADTTMQEIASADNIAGYILDTDSPVSCTPYSEESVSQYLWPYHFARLDLTLKRQESPYGIEKTDEETTLESFL